MSVFKIGLIFTLLVGGIIWTVNLDVDGKHQQTPIGSMANAIS
jgi:hypothetical protein